MPRTVTHVDEALAVMRRLERIEALDKEHAPAPTLIAELRELVREAEDWVRAEGDPPEAQEAVERVTEALDGAILPA